MQKPAHILEHEQAMFERFGLRPEPMRYPCPRVVAGTRCRGETYDDLPDCVCVDHRHLLDHARVWRDRRRALVLTAEPYDLNDKRAALDRLITACRLLGLTVTVSADSPWCPGYTSLLTIRRRPHADRA